jgi:hypothetical protein
MPQEGEEIYKEWLEAASKPGGMTWQQSKNLWEETYRKHKAQAEAVAKRLLGNKSRPHDVNPYTGKCTRCGRDEWNRKKIPECDYRDARDYGN